MVDRANKTGGRPEVRGKLSLLIYRFIFIPFRDGLFGFGTLFTVILFARLFEYLLFSGETFATDLEDLKTALIGFVLFSTLSFAKGVYKQFSGL